MAGTSNLKHSIGQRLYRNVQKHERETFSSSGGGSKFLFQLQGNNKEAKNITAAIYKPSLPN